METGSAIPNATDGASKIQKNFAARPRLIVAAIAALTAGGIAAALTAPGFRWPAQEALPSLGNRMAIEMQTGPGPLLNAAPLAVASVVIWVCVLAVLMALLRASIGLFTAALGALCLVVTVEILQGSISVLAAPLCAGALLALAELGYWTFELRMTAPQSNATIRRRAGVILSLVAVGTGASALLLALDSQVATLGI